MSRSRAPWPAGEGPAGLPTRSRSTARWRSGWRALGRMCGGRSARPGRSSSGAPWSERSRKPAISTNSRARPMQRLYFGTDGVRGPYGGPVMNEAFVARLGAAAAGWLESRGVRSGRVLIGRDTRASGASLAGAFGEGFLRTGGRPVALGIVPTPAVSRAVRLGGASLGAVITASHNPASDNGFKLFRDDGFKLTDAEEAEFETHMPPEGAVSVGGGRRVEIPGESVTRGYIGAAAAILPAGS